MFPREPCSRLSRAQDLSCVQLTRETISPSSECLVVFFLKVFLCESFPKKKKKRSYAQLNCYSRISYWSSSRKQPDVSSANPTKSCKSEVQIFMVTCRTLVTPPRPSTVCTSTKLPSLRQMSPWGGHVRHPSPRCCSGDERPAADRSLFHGTSFISRLCTSPFTF